MIERRRQRRFGAKLAMGLAATAIGLSGCSSLQSDGVDPIAWYRDMSGNSANDAQDKGPNSKNLAEGDKEPYPNLASVPAPPDNAITKADREKLAQSLIADRQNAQYTDQQLRAGQNLAAVPPPALEAAMAASANPAQAAAPGAGSSSASRMTAAPRAPVRQEALALPAASPGQTTQAADATPASQKKKKADDSKKKQAKLKRGSVSPPAESPLKSPTLGAMPQGDQAAAVPPRPPGTPRSARRSVLRPARSEELAAAAPTRSDVEESGAEPRSNGSARGTEIQFSPGPFRARILPAAQKQLAGVAQLAMRNHGKVRIVGYGGAAAQGDLTQREFQSFDAALDNAKAVALALTKLGVPANRIDVETVAKVNSPDRAEIFVEQ
jgi:hypothetical protein